MALTISPIPAPVSGDAQTDRISARKIVMQTNRTSLPSLPPEETPSTPESITSDPKIENEVVEETKPLSPQFAALAKERRALQVKEREIADRERALSESNKGLIDPAQLKSNPLKMLLEHGVTYDQLTQEILASQENPEILALKNEIKSLKEGVDDKFKTREQQQEQAALNEMKKEAEQLSKTSDFELIRVTGSIPDVMRLIESTYRQTGEVLDVAEAMKLVEDELLNENMKIASVEKIKTALQPKQEQLLAPKTLTSRNTATQPMSAKQRAIAAFYGTLKK